MRAIGVAACAVLGAAYPASSGAAVPAPWPAEDRAVEIHQRLVLKEGERAVALTLDACGGGFDAQLIDTLIELRVPATVFVTRTWIDKNPAGMAQLAAHPDLFAIEDHGASHIPAVIGGDKHVFGLRGEPDLAHLQAEVAGGARAIVASGAPGPDWYRGATARYDQAAISGIQAMGYRIAGFSINADAGATLPRREIVARLVRAQPSDIIIAHMNKPAGDSAEGLRDALPLLLARGMTFVTLRGRQVEAIPSALPAKS